MALVWRRAAEGFAEVSADRVGNTIARVPGTAGGPLLALFGHVDEIGVTVTHADERGYVAFRPIGGGIAAEVLVGQRVELQGRDGPVRGVVAARRDPRRREKKKPLDQKSLHIDIGARDRGEALGLLQVGDVGVVAAEPLELRNGRLAARALDNRLGAYIALEVLRRIAGDGGSPGDVAAVATVQEEVGDLSGARTAAFALEPEVGIVLDVTPATDMPGGDADEQGEQRLGGGASILRGPGVHPRVFELLRDTAEADGIPYTVEVSTGKSWTDMDAVNVSRAGVATGVVSIATRYLHTPVEMVELTDVEACIRLVAAFAQRLEPGLDLTP